MVVKITGWCEGFQKVAFNKYLRSHAGYSIAGAKEIVDLVLANQVVEVAFQNFGSADLLQNDFTKMGLVFEIIED